MNAIQLAMWRDAAVILLAIQAIVLGLLPAVALYWSVRGMRRFQRWVRPVLFQTRLYIWRAEHEARRVVNAVAAPFVWVRSTVVGVQRALHILGWR
jgi:hypothetical protein